MHNKIIGISTMNCLLEALSNELPPRAINAKRNNIRISEGTFLNARIIGNRSKKKVTTISIFGNKYKNVVGF